MHLLAKRTRLPRSIILAVAALLAFSLVSATALVVLAHQGLPHATTALSLSLHNAKASGGLDPNMLEDSAAYDTRPCAARPSYAACNGLYPVTPPHVEPQLGATLGAGACIDRASRIVENQSIPDTRGNSVGTLKMFWLPTCQSYFGYLSFTFPLDQVSSLAIWVQTESDNAFVQWWNSVSQLPPTVVWTEQTGPVAGMALQGQELYSPLIYSPSAPVSAHFQLTLANGATYDDFTSSYSKGVAQYNG